MIKIKAARTGICHLCGNHTKLTFEHIPPEAAFNKHRVKLYKLLETNQQNMPWDFEGVKYIDAQKGTGGHTICGPCNNNTGHWYGNDYASFAVNVMEIMANNKFEPKQTVEIHTKKIFPARILKQVLSMFCSLNSHTFVEKFGLREYILGKHQKAIDRTKFKLSMYLSAGSLLKQIPLAAMSVGIDLESQHILLVSELTTQPLGFIFDASSQQAIPPGLELNHFAEYGYDDCVDLVLRIPIFETNTGFPTDYRSKDEIIKQASIS